MKRSAITIASIFSLACATYGQKIDFSLVEQLQTGISTKEDAIKLLGKPNVVSVGDNGLTVMNWTYAHANSITGKSESSHLTLIFDKYGKLLRKTTGEFNGQNS